MTQSRVSFIHCLYFAKLIPVLRIGYIAQMVERRYDDLEIAGQCWFEPTERHYFSSSNARLLAYVFSGEKNDQSVTNQLEYTGFRQKSFLQCICKFFK